MGVKERYERVLAWFAEHNPDAETELAYSNPYELLVAVILSAQCTDKRVNIVTPEFFKVYPTAEALSKAEDTDIFPLIKSISYPNNKAKSLAGMGRLLMSEFSGVVPADVNELQKLPGVGRKTANVIASVIYNKPAMAVDTHVNRVSKRIGLVPEKATTPLAVEKYLMKYIPEALVHKAHHWLILHGRYVCKAQKPNCKECGITELCKYFEKIKV